MHNIVKLLCLTAAFIFGLTAAPAQNAPLKLTLFGQPSVNNDAIWMAFEKGFYQEEGLDVTYRLFPSGTTAFQAFQTGQGDIVMTGDLPSVQYFFRVKGDYRTIAVIERDAKGYVVVAGKDIKSRKTSRARPSPRALGRPAPGSFRNISPRIRSIRRPSP